MFKIGQRVRIVKGVTAMSQKYSGEITTIYSVVMTGRDRDTVHHYNVRMPWAPDTDFGLWPNEVVDANEFTDAEYEVV